MVEHAPENSTPNIETVKEDKFRLYKEKEKREKFRKNVESLCRHAITVRADVIIFLDQSARFNSVAEAQSQLRRELEMIAEESKTKLLEK